jgi:hypothetical protein
MEPEQPSQAKPVPRPASPRQPGYRKWSRCRGPGGLSGFASSWVISNCIAPCFSWAQRHHQQEQLMSQLALAATARLLSNLEPWLRGGATGQEEEQHYQCCEESLPFRIASLPSPRQPGFLGTEASSARTIDVTAGFGGHCPSAFQP